MPEGIDIAALLNSPPEEIINQFESKGYQVTWNWREMEREAHARAFTVAKAINLDVLKSIREEVESALANGTTFATFQKNLEPKLKELGWWGRKEIVDEETGEILDVQLGSAWRLKNIYRTNLSTSYSAGRFKTQKAAAERRPWWVYRAVQDASTRPSHEALHNTVVRHDDPFWDTHYPPNDWGCRCGVDSLSDKQLEARGYTVSTGDQIPNFAGEGWDYNPGQSYWQPDLNAFSAELAEKYVSTALEGQGLSVMYSRSKSLVDDLLTQGLSLAQIRKRMPREQFPVAVLPELYRKAINADAHTVILSADTLAKQLIRHPEMQLTDYRKLQLIYNEAQLVVNNRPRTLIFFYKDERNVFTSVKATLKKDELYLTSFRFADNQTPDEIRKQGKVIKDELK
ncbi:MAG: phage minor head protein [Balneola sp.]